MADSVPERRSPHFTEQVSKIVLYFAGVGALLVLADPVLVLDLGNGHSLKIGGEGFSEQLKGAVVQSLMIGGFTAVIGYWLGSSAGSRSQQEAVSRIAESAAPATASAVAANVAATVAATASPPPIPVVPVEGEPPKKGKRT